MWALLFVRPRWRLPAGCKNAATSIPGTRRTSPTAVESGGRAGGASKFHHESVAFCASVPCARRPSMPSALPRCMSFVDIETFVAHSGVLCAFPHNKRSYLWIAHGRINTRNPRTPRQTFSQGQFVDRPQQATCHGYQERTKNTKKHIFGQQRPRTTQPTIARVVCCCTHTHVG